MASAYGRRRVGLRPTPKIPAAREKNLWYPGYSELEDNQRNCSECKKLLEIREGAKKLPSNLWQTLVSVLRVGYDQYLTHAQNHIPLAAVGALPVNRLSVWGKGQKIARRVKGKGESLWTNI